VSFELELELELELDPDPGFSLTPGGSLAPLLPTEDLHPHVAYATRRCMPTGN
jgi:hypothetical protein